MITRRKFLASLSALAAFSPFARGKPPLVPDCAVQTDTDTWTVFPAQLRKYENAVLKSAENLRREMMQARTIRMSLKIDDKSFKETQEPSNAA